MASRFDVLKMALDAVAKRAPKVVDTVTDAVKNIDVAPVKEAVKRVADDAVAAADDWGWKGGKPGEITADIYDERVNAIYPEAMRELEKRGYTAADLNKKYSEAGREYLDLDYRMSSKLDDAVKRQIEGSSNEDFKRAFELAGQPIVNFMGDMRYLQNADIPREWTGKVWTAMRNREAFLGKRARWFGPQDISDAMRPMTNDQRETFLALLPEWTESLDDLVNAVKNF